MEGDAPIDAAAKAASYNVLLQVLLRVSTFILNAIVLRFIHAQLLGVVNLRLTLLYNTVLFLSREALRKTALTRSVAHSEWSHTANLMWCSLPLGLLSSALLGLLWLSPAITQPDVPYDGVGVAIFCVAAVTELAAEPLWILGQMHHYVTLKVVAEGVPQLLRCLVVVVGVTMATQWGLLVFCVGQLVYSLCYLLIYYGYFTLHTSNPHPLPIRTISHLLPSPGKDKRWFGPQALLLSWSFFKQSFLKQLLTDGERYIMTVSGVLTFAQQGVYDVINNLGSLVARFIFLPIEESFYVFFARTLYRGGPAARQKEGTVSLSANTLTMLLKFVLLVALTILSFGYSYSYLALDIYGGHLLSGGEGPSLLRWYCVYVLLLAVNGVTECFVFAAMSQVQVDRYNRVMIVFSLVFLSASLLLTRLFGSVGFILANCVNMATRILHSCHFIHKFFHPTPHSPLYTSLPSPLTIATFVAAFVATGLSESLFCCDSGWSYRLVHIAIGAITLLGVGFVVMTTEQELMLFLVNRLPTRVRNVLQRMRLSRPKTD